MHWWTNSHVSVCKASTPFYNILLEVGICI